MKRRLIYLILFALLGVSACSGQGDADGNRWSEGKRIVYDASSETQPGRSRAQRRPSEKQKAFLRVTSSPSNLQPERFEEFSSLYPPEERNSWSLDYFSFQDDSIAVINSSNFNDLYGVLLIGNDEYYFLPGSENDFDFIFEDIMHK
ncbi:hypothetical protein GRI97_04375 [Altererythrobacter xixiisoli]|uniref:Lipoprotein n=1 Tax=Croceibacterium xixiisoli TaxID=1476466 RepID=A0A6I4TSX1_9SPHN|nr:hypothetical protein [Croceibacterium xixiisoli]MXO98221.1 hypothetical protein [Croceibacterium xixiisoli]